MPRSVTLPYRDGTYEVSPRLIVAVGLNYRDHVAEHATLHPDSAPPEPEPSEPVLFGKLPGCLVGDGEAVVIPPILGHYAFADERTDYEGELALVIGVGGRDIDASVALDHVAGVTCANDISQRNLQNGDRSGWFRAKGFDTFLPIGPRLVPIDDLPGPLESLTIETRHNGTVVQRARLGEMIHAVPALIAWISRNFALEPGDVILTGTPAGVGPISGGDVVEVEIEGIGTLKNPVIDPR